MGRSRRSQLFVCCAALWFAWTTRHVKARYLPKASALAMPGNAALAKVFSCCLSLGWCWRSAPQSAVCGTRHTWTRTESPTHTISGHVRSSSALTSDGWPPSSSRTRHQRFIVRSSCRTRRPEGTSRMRCETRGSAVLVMRDTCQLRMASSTCVCTAQLLGHSTQRRVRLHDVAEMIGLSWSCETGGVTVIATDGKRTQ